MLHLATTMNPAMQAVYRQATLHKIEELLTDPDLPAGMAERARAWLSAKERSLLSLERLRDRCQELVSAVRLSRQLGALCPGCGQLPGTNAAACDACYGENYEQAA
ncbi:MAG: hypothetical protein ACRYFX_09310 [Janthinobacterium lividum]